MADTTVLSDHPPPLSTTDYDDFGLSVPPLDAAFFSQHFLDNDGGEGDNQDDVVIDDLDFDFSFDDLDLPSAEELDDLLNPGQILEIDTQLRQGVNFPQLAPNLDQLHGLFKSNSSELRHISREGDFAGVSSSNGSGELNSVPVRSESHQISDYLNVLSPESNGSNRGVSDNCGRDANFLDCSSPESRGSGNCGTNVSEDSNNGVTRSVSSSSNLNNRVIRTGNEKIKLEEPSKNKANSSLLKRKKDSEDLLNNTVESRINKYKKSCSNLENNSNSNSNNNNGAVSEEEEKRKVRLIRNRESAQLSRQRKKHYVEELEGKVKMMHSTIQDLNAKISYFMAENAALRQQMGGGAAVPSPPMAPPPPGMYPHPAMMYPWMPCAPPYMIKPQGSQVPLVPIPRLKPQQPAQAPKATQKVESKNEGTKTKKVASVSFLGLLFFIFLFGCLVPMINVRYGGVRETLTGGESYIGGEFCEKHHGRVLLLNGTVYSKKYGDGRDFSSKSGVLGGRSGHDSGGKPNADEFVRLSNGSEPLVASLYVPRNDKLVKIDGNLIIHSVLASERAMPSHGKRVHETGLAVPGELGPYIPVPGVQTNGVRHPHLRALGSGSADQGSRKQATDGRLQQWFREGLAGPMLSSGMCTEVFQFDVSSASASGAIVSAPTRNTSEEQNQNSTQLSKGRNRRILHDLPVQLPKSSNNISRQHSGRNPQEGNLNGNSSSAPMVVSVLVDPREAVDSDVDGVMGRKSLSQIFVVVLIDSVKYVTYSCMLPFKGSASHLVTA